MKRPKKDPIREDRIHNEAIVDAYGPEEQAIGIEKEGTGIAAGTLIGVVAQYSSGSRTVVDERSASLMIQIFVPFLRL